MQIIMRLKPLVVTILLFLVWKITPLSGIPAKFIKAKSFIETFELFFFPMLLVLSFVFQARLMSLKTLKGMLLSVSYGYAASMLSLFCVWFIESKKISDIFYWLNGDPSFQAYLLIFLIP